MGKPTFQQRHYEAIALTLQQCYPCESIIRELADMFQRDNSNFDRGRFERACVPGANVRKRAA